MADTSLAACETRRPYKLRQADNVESYSVFFFVIFVPRMACTGESRISLMLLPLKSCTVQLSRGSGFQAIGRRSVRCRFIVLRPRRPETPKPFSPLRATCGTQESAPFHDTGFLDHRQVHVHLVGIICPPLHMSSVEHVT